MSKKVASHRVTRHKDSSNNSTPANMPGRLITNRIFVGNIPSNLIERDLIMLFHRFGKICDAKIIPDHTRDKSYGFVTFFSEADARRAIQASVQHDCVMWGDRKLNVAPAIQRGNMNTGNINNPSSMPPSSSGYQTPRIAHNSFYATQVEAPAATMYANTRIGTPTDVHQQQTVEPIQMDPSNNALYQTVVLCRLPHQYAMTQCHQYTSSSSGHYFVAPGFQPYVQTASPIPEIHQASHYASYASITPLTPSCSSVSWDKSVVAEGQSGACTDSNGGDSGNGNKVDLAFGALPLRDNEIPQHNNKRIPLDHAPIYFLKVFFPPAPLR